MLGYGWGMSTDLRKMEPKSKKWCAMYNSENCSPDLHCNLLAVWSIPLFSAEGCKIKTRTTILCLGPGVTFCIDLIYSTGLPVLDYRNPLGGNTLSSVAFLLPPIGSPHQNSLPNLSITRATNRPSYAQSLISRILDNIPVNWGILGVEINTSGRLPIG